MAKKPKQEKLPAHETLVGIVEELFREAHLHTEGMGTTVFTSGLNLALRLLQTTSFPAEHLPAMIRRLLTIEPVRWLKKEKRLLADAIVELNEDLKKATSKTKALKN